MTFSIRQNSFLLIIVYMFLSSFSELLKRYLTFSFDSATMNFYRFLFGGVTLLIFSIHNCSEDLKQIVSTGRALRYHFLLALLLTGNMYLFTTGMSLTNAVTSGLFLILCLPMTALLAGLLYKDERKLLKKPGFLLALALTTASITGFVLSGSAAAPDKDYLKGITTLAISTIFISCQNILVKKVTGKFAPMAVSTITAFMTCLLFGVLALMTGHLGVILQVPPETAFLLCLSGIYGLPVGMAFAFFLIRREGAIRFNLIQLSVPALTGLLGYLILRESLSIEQVFCGILILTGCALSIRVSASNPL